MDESRPIEETSTSEVERQDAPRLPTPHPRRTGSGRRGLCIGVALLALISLGLNTWGLSWGMPNVVSWAADTVAGTRTLNSMGRWPDRWRTHYPPLHLLLNQLAYRPILAHWQRSGQMTWMQFPAGGTARPTPNATPGDPNVEPRFRPPVWENLGLLIMVSRGITVAMSIATVLIVAAIGFHLFGDARAGLLAGLTLATCAEWVFFSHLGNLDIPHMFWFALSIYAYVRGCQTDRWWHFVFLGVFTACAVATKDAIAGMYVGVAVMLVVTRVGRLRAADIRSVADRLHAKLWLGLTSFALPYALIQGLFTAPHVYVNRLKYYLVGEGTAGFNQAYEGPWWLARETVAVAAKALGWPMLAVMAGALVYAFMRGRRQTLWLFVPCATYYLLVCSYTGMVYARMLFPVYILLGLLVGQACTAWITWPRVPRAVRYGSTTGLFLLSIGYCAAVDLELADDTRYRVEDWIAQHVDTADTIGVFAHPQYLPRFFKTGHRALPLDMSRDSIESEQPRYLILISHNYDDFDSGERACMRALVAGELGYELVANYEKQHVPPAARWYAIAGWGTRGAGKASPAIHVLKRKQ